MNRILSSRRAIGIAAFALVASVAVASTPPFSFVHFGNFKRMMHMGDTSGQIKLSQVPKTVGTWGVGALAGLKGEILVADGSVLVSRGTDPQGRLEATKVEDEAVLFASATVTEWTEVAIARDMNQAALEAFVVQQAKAKGIDTEQPFAFLVDGTYPSLQWHVVTGDTPSGQNAGGHGGNHSNHKTAMREFKNAGSSGRLVGIYSGKNLEGVVSHPGERFHLHYVDHARTVSGHVDSYAVQAGSVLKLPAIR